jgi:formylglycine-generating enzyme required for sulfatase activity
MNHTPYVVPVRCLQYGTKRESQGSAVYIAPTLLLTCRHVVRPEGSGGWATKIEIGAGTKAKVYEAQSQAKFRDVDLVVLETKEKFDEKLIAPWREAEGLRRGDPVIATSYPKGKYSNARHCVHHQDTDQFIVDGPFLAGASGGVVRYAEDPDFWCCALIDSRSDRSGHATPFQVIVDYLKELGLRLPTARKQQAPVALADVERYRARLRGTLGEMDLGGLLLDGAKQRVGIEKLWVPALTQSGGKEIPLAQAVHENRVLVIEAEAGSGKTTFLRRIGYAMVRQERRREALKIRFSGLPLFVPLKGLEDYIAANLKQGDPKPTDADALEWIGWYLASRDEARECGLDHSFFEHQLKEETCEALLLLDGLDELSPKWRGPLSELISLAVRRYRCRIVISTRPEVYHLAKGKLEGLFEGAVRLPILPMDDTAVSEFIALWSEFAKQSPERLQKAVKRPAIRKYARNPLMLTAMAVLTHGNKELPQQRAALFEAIVDWLVTSRRPEDPDTLRQHLSYLALAMIQQGSGNKYQISLSKAAELMKDNFVVPQPQVPEEAAIAFLEEAQQKTGLLTLRGNELSFWHRYLQEFLAARRLKNWTDGRAKLIPKLVEGRESPEVVRLVAGLMAGQPEDLSALLRSMIDAALARPLERRAYVVGLLGSTFEDLKPTSYFETGPYRREVDAKWQELSQSVYAIFEDQRATQKIPIRTRADAADALGMAGDQRLRLPDETGYWVKVPGGEFWMGAQAQNPQGRGYDPEAYEDEDRGQKNPVSVDSFEIGKFLVTVHEYEAYLQERGLVPAWEMRFEEQLRFPNRPLVLVTQEEATEYCMWLSAQQGAIIRLPREEEWEFAARGGAAQRKYPWGNEEPTHWHANFSSKVGRLTAVGLFPKGATTAQEGSEVGRIYDLAGNVWEWTSSRWSSTLTFWVVRGGSFYYDARYLRASFRGNDEADERNNFFGFRCLREVFS